VKGIDRLLKQCGFFINDGLHYAMETEEFLFAAATLVDVGGDHKGHGAGDAHKTAKEERSVVIASEGTEPSEGTPSGKSAENEIGAGGFERAKTERGPDGERQTKEGKAVPFGPEKRGRAEDKDTKNAKTSEEEENLDEFIDGGTMVRVFQDEDEERSQGERAEGIPNPPGEPNRTKIVPVGETGVAEDADTDCGADGGGEETGKTDKAENILGSVESLGTVCELIDKVGAHKGLQRVADGNAGRDNDGGVDMVIDEESTGKDGGPSTIADEEQSGEGDTRRRPESGGMRIHTGQTETEPTASIIDRHKKSEISKVAKVRGTHELDPPLFRKKS